MATLRVLLALGLLLVTCGTVQAQGLLSGFDRTERKIVQAALALTQDYDGLVDGDFGRRSQAALQAYLGRDAAQDPKSRFDDLLRAMAADWQRLAWDDAATPNRVIHFVRPTAPGADGGLSVSVRADSSAAARSQHNATVASHSAEGRPYTVRRDDFLVSASELADGGRIYVRSDRRSGGFDTLMIVADVPNRGRLQLVASSVTRAGPPRLDPFAAPKIAAIVGPRGRPIQGLRIAQDLVLVLGASGCQGVIGPTGAPVEQIAQNDLQDLTLVRVPLPPGGVAPLAPPQSLGLGSDVRVAGAMAEVVAASSALLSIGPADILAATQVRPGEDVLRLAAPVAPGTPVLDTSGALVGLVLRVVEDPTAPEGHLAIIASQATVSALVPSGTTVSAVSGSAEIALTCLG